MEYNYTNNGFNLFFNRLVFTFIIKDFNFTWLSYEERKILIEQSDEDDDLSIYN